MLAEAPPAALLDAARRRSAVLVADAPGATGFEVRTAREVLRAEERMPCALVVSAWVEAERLDALVARLRDLLADELYVLHPDTAELTARLRALGLRPVRADGGWRLQRYRLREYKRTPRWLGPRHWAHPELWGRFRW